MTTTAAATWPTMAELSRVSAKVVDAFTAIEGLPNFAALTEELEGDTEASMPTLEQFAALSWFLEIVESDIENMRTYLGPIRDARRMAASCMEAAMRDSDG